MAKGDQGAIGGATNRINPNGMQQFGGPGANYRAPGNSTISNNMISNGGAINGGTMVNGGTPPPPIGPSNSSSLIAQILAQKYAQQQQQNPTGSPQVTSPQLANQPIDSGTGFNNTGVSGYGPDGINPPMLGYGGFAAQPSSGNMMYTGGSPNFNEQDGKGYTGNDVGLFGPGGPLASIGPSNQDALIKLFMQSQYGGGPKFTSNGLGAGLNGPGNPQ